MLFFKRVFAFCIDILIIGLLLQVYFNYFGIPNDEGGYTLRGIDTLFILSVWYSYFVLQEFYFKSTIGKLIFGIVIRKVDSSAIILTDILKRRSFDILELLFLPIIPLVLVLTTKDNQRIGDLLARTKTVTRIKQRK
jgi:uncharacterized RDD family membrane protein YckC